MGLVLGEPVVSSVARCLGPVGNRGLVEDVSHVGVDRPGAQD